MSEPINVTLKASLVKYSVFLLNESDKGNKRNESIRKLNWRAAGRFCWVSKLKWMDSFSLCPPLREGIVAFIIMTSWFCWTYRQIVKRPRFSALPHTNFPSIKLTLSTLAHLAVCLSALYIIDNTWGFFADAATSTNHAHYPLGRWVMLSKHRGADVITARAWSAFLFGIVSVGSQASKWWNGLTIYCSCVRNRT